MIRTLKEDVALGLLTTEQYQAGTEMLLGNTAFIDQAITLIGRSVPSTLKKAKLWSVLDSEMAEVWDQFSACEILFCNSSPTKNTGKATKKINSAQKKT